jgi:hypothetical protein
MNHHAEESTLGEMKPLKDYIQGVFPDYGINYRIHATRRMFQRNIHPEDIEKVLQSGNVIEEYPEDYPLPSFLISGTTQQGKPLHVVIGVNNDEKELVIITAYEPSIDKWTNSFTRRR